MTDPLLSIGIPTYNRAGCLRQCLDSIFVQFKNPEIAEKVEVVVSDNCSMDNTEAVVLEFKKKFSNLVYKKNLQNFGVDRNILQVTDLAKGKYVWFLGDDDALFPGALEYILEVLQNQSSDYYIVNCWGYNNSLTQQALNYPNISEKQDKHYNSLEKYVKERGQDIGLVGFFCGLSVQIFLKAHWEAFLNKEQYIGTNAVHLHTLMTVMKNRPFSVLAKPCVKVRADNIRWDVFEGLNTLSKRARQTQKTFLWILKEYSIPYSQIKLQLSFYWDVFVNTARVILRKHILKSQKSRDILKKILGKL